MDVLDEQPAASEQAGTRRSQGWRRWLAAAVAWVALVAVVATFGAIALARSGAPGVTRSAGPAGAVPKDWKLYHDPLGLFRVRIPPNWKATGGVDGTYSAGSPQGSFSGKSESISFDDPALGDASAKIWVTAWQLNSPLARASYCDASASDHETMMFNGYRAGQIDPPGTVWLFESSNAHFQIDVKIPGVLEPLHSNPAMMTIPPTPTPLPQAMVSADRTIIATSLASFRPTAKPLICS